MSLALIVQGHNSLFLFKLEKDTEKSNQPYGTTNLSVIRRPVQERDMDLGSRDYPGSQKNKFTRKTTSRTDNTIFSSVKQFMIQFLVSTQSKSRTDLKVGSLVPIL